MAKITVLMPVYNCSPYLKEAVESILNQDISDFELLAIDDGSSDSPEKVMQQFSDPRIRFVQNKKNRGLVHVLNQGLSMIDSPYIARMDGDDTCDPSRLRKLSDYLDKHPDIGVCSSFLKTFGRSEELWSMPTDDASIKAGLVFGSSLPHAPCMFRRAVLEKFQIRYSAEHPHLEDYDLWLRLMDHTHFHIIPEALYGYRILDHNVTVRNKASIVERKKAIFKKVFQRFGFEPSPLEMDLHIGFAYGSIELNPKNIKLYFSYLQKLKRVNAEKKAFPVKELNEVIHKRWKAFFFTLPPTGIKNVIAYWSSGGFSIKEFIFVLKFTVSKFRGKI